jgi:hypothetical protein
MYRRPLCTVEKRSGRIVGHSDIVSDPGGPHPCSGEGGTGSKMPNSK